MPVSFVTGFCLVLSFHVCRKTPDSSVVQVLNKPSKPDGQPGSSRVDLEGASVALIQAAGLFKRLTLLPKGQLHSRGLKKENITKHVTHCDKLSQHAMKLIDKVKTADDMRQVRLNLFVHQQSALECSLFFPDLQLLQRTKDRNNQFIASYCLCFLVFYC